MRSLALLFCLTVRRALARSLQCDDGSSESVALLTMTMGACESDPLFLQHGGSGCCRNGNVSWVGVCDDCSGSFSCDTVDNDSAESDGSTSPSGWGVWVALFADIFISVGLVLQKVAHNRVAHMHHELDEAREEEEEEATGKGSERPGVPPCGVAYTRLPIWWLGLGVTVAAEAGNFVAYGDTSTAAAVIASIGCVGVVSNWLIATLVLKEAFRWRDAAGVLLVVGGVVLIVYYVPYATTAHSTAAGLFAIGGTTRLVVCPLWYSANYSAAPCGAVPAVWPSGDSLASEWLTGLEVCERSGVWAFTSDYWYASRPAWLLYSVLCAGAWCVLYTLTRRRGWKSVFVFLALADLAGGFTVAAAVTVSTFLFNLVVGPCLLGMGGACEAYVLAEPAFWVAVLVLAVTAVTQVVYLNKAMQLFDASVVVPVHYVFFTLNSIVAPSILYQQLSLDSARLAHPAALMLSCFCAGLLLTFSGVSIISGGPRAATAGAAGRGGAGPGADDADLRDPPPMSAQGGTAARLAALPADLAVASDLGPVRARRTTRRARIASPMAGGRVAGETYLHYSPYDRPHAPQAAGGGAPDALLLHADSLPVASPPACLASSVADMYDVFPSQPAARGAGGGESAVDADARIPPA